MAYRRGDFGSFSKAERVLAMQEYLKKIEGKLRDGDADFTEAHLINLEIEDLTDKINRGRSSIGFRFDEFQACKQKYRFDAEYREEIEAKIDGTWVDPKKVKTDQENA